MIRGGWGELTSSGVSWLFTDSGVGAGCGAGGLLVEEGGYDETYGVGGSGSEAGTLCSDRAVNNAHETWTWNANDPSLFPSPPEL